MGEEVTQSFPNISLAANQPLHVAALLAELCQGQAIPFPSHDGSYSDR